MGGLSWVPSVQDTNKTKIDIQFRAKVEENNDLKFSLGYKTKNVSLTKKDLLSETTSFTDWIIHNCPTSKLVINVTLPPNSTVSETLPPTDITGQTIMFDEEGLRALEHWHIVVFYTTRRLTTRLWKAVATWVALAVLGGVAGNNADRILSGALVSEASTAEDKNGN